MEGDLGTSQEVPNPVVDWITDDLKNLKKDLKRATSV